MKRLTPPPFDDAAALLTLANHRGLSSYDELLRNLTPIQRSYLRYTVAAGDPALAEQPCGLPASLARKLKAHYKKPPTALPVIGTIRRELSPTVCPMCGSPGFGTVDHVFPKELYPELCLHSRNLVPACACNVSRKSAFWDKAAGRVLHPYFDEVLNSRLVRATIAGPFETATLGLELCCGPIPELPRVQFHVRHIVEKTPIIEFLRTQWVNLRRQHTTVPELTGAVMQSEQFMAAAHNVLTRFDAEYATPNNWKSIFWSGLVNSPEACDFALAQINAVKQGLLDPESI
jgi:hypothetical protein